MSFNKIVLYKLVLPSEKKIKHMCMFFSAFYCVLSKVVYMSIIFNLKKAFDIFSFRVIHYTRQFSSGSHASAETLGKARYAGSALIKGFFK